MLAVGSGNYLDVTSGLGRVPNEVSRSRGPDARRFSVVRSPEVARPSDPSLLRIDHPGERFANQIQSPSVRGEMDADQEKKADASVDAVGNTDLELVEQASRGSGRAFHTLFVKHRSSVLRLVMRMLHGSPDVEDVVQDVFVHVHRSLKGFRGDSKFSTWLYRLTVNVVKMHLRSQKSRPRLDGSVMPVDETSSDVQPDEAVDQQRRVTILNRCVARISDKKREVWILHDLEGVAAKDIAEVLEIPILTVRTRLFYARKELHDMLREEGGLEADNVAIGDAPEPKSGVVLLNPEGASR